MLVVTPEQLTERMAGPAIRALELARVLGAAAGIGEVVLASLSASSRAEPGVRLVVADEARLRTEVGAAGSVVVQGDVLGLHPWLADSDVPLVVDAYDPYHLEQLEQATVLGEARRRAVVRDCVRSLSRQLSRADLVLCASDRQRTMWIGHLAALGRVNPLTYDDDRSLRRLLAVVPFGIQAEPPVRGRGARSEIAGIGPDDQLLLWGGGLYDWFDPVTVIRAVGELAGAYPLLRLLFLGTAHPVAGVGSGRVSAAARTVADSLGLTGRAVFFHDGWVPYDERGWWLAEADLGVSAHHDHLETEFSFRTRILDYLWAGLPVVTTAGDSMADLVACRGAGTTVAPGDVDGWRAALSGLVDDAGRRASCGEAARAAARELGWGSAAAPLVEFCRAPYRAPDLLVGASEQALLGLDRAGPGPLARVGAAFREGGPRLLLRRLRDRILR